MRRWLFVPALALAACQTQTMERDQMGLWKQGDSAPSNAPAQPDDAPDKSPGTVITIPADVVQAHAEFVNRPSTIFAESVEIDLSANGWLALASFSVSPDAVIRRDEEDTSRGVVQITLRRIPDIALTADAVPTVRFGDGMRVAAVDSIVLRFWKQQSVDRPQWFHAAGRGKAVFVVESEPRREWRGSTVDVRAEIRKTGATYQFVSDQGAKP